MSEKQSQIFNDEDKKVEANSHDEEEINGSELDIESIK